MPFVIRPAPWLFLNCFVFPGKPDNTVPNKKLRSIWTVPLVSKQPLFSLLSLGDSLLLNFSVRFIGMSW